MRFKIAVRVGVFVLIAFMAWACFTWPVVEASGVWTDESHVEADTASLQPVERPPTPMEVALRGAICAASLLLGFAIVRAARSRKPG